MTKFIGRLIIIFFCFIFIMTFLNEQNISTNNKQEVYDQQILISSSELYLQPVEEAARQDAGKPEQESVTYYIAQWIEKSGLMLYEGILTIISDLAKVI